MDKVCPVSTTLRGKTEDTRPFQRELVTDRKANHDHSEPPIGASQEVWEVASLAVGDHRID